ncbi:hypothetical protein QYE76_055563 [Lolium multiflorum]|uniref:Uncharacterized protein n=1 Tax=Lolium multiflorum TaxID=4521 RepID=A0AAD8WM08_LOLMU|nr:hypothetical protein QYE76_055563 [Lolium multiflorum]
MSTADARKALLRSFFGSWDLAEAHNKCQAFPEASLEALKAQVAALQGLFPDSQAHAIKKVAEHRAQQAR